MNEGLNALSDMESCVNTVVDFKKYHLSKNIVKKELEALKVVKKYGRFSRSERTLTVVIPEGSTKDLDILGEAMV